MTFYSWKEESGSLADKCEVQISYAIGVTEPTSISVNTFGTGNVADSVIERLIRKHLDLRPYGGSPRRIEYSHLPLLLKLARHCRK